MDMFLKSLLPQLMKDPEIKATIETVGRFVTTLDARLERIERAAGIVPAQVIPIKPPNEGQQNAQTDKRG